MDNVYEVESPGTCAVALYDYQGGRCAIQDVGKAIILTGEALGVWPRWGGEMVVHTINSGKRILSWLFQFLPHGKIE